MARFAMNKFEILPAVDVKEGKSVRLKQGEPDEKSIYGSPIDCALDFQKAGASWLHLVDLDAAYGVGNNSKVLLEVINSLEIKVELSGGINNDQSLSRALATNCDRVVLSTLALENLVWSSEVVKKYSDKIAVSLDIKDQKLAPRGAITKGGDLFEAISHLTSVGCALFIVTDVTRDGNLSGPNFELLEKVCEFTKVPVIASGGISSLADIEKLHSMQKIGVTGAIVGKALYEGAFTLAEALTLVNS